MDSLIIEKVKKLIQDNDEFYEFSTFGDGTDIKIIEGVEEKLGLCFSPSYKWWLSNYGGGCVGGSELFSVYEDYVDDIPLPGGDIVYMRNLNLNSGHYKSNELVFMENEQDIFYFDLNQKSENGEYFIFEKNTNRLFAIDFFDFLLKIFKLYGG